MKETFAERLKGLRHKNTMTIEQLEEKSGIPYSTIQNWESGRIMPNSVALIKLADFFNVTTDYLLGRTEQ